MVLPALPVHRAPVFDKVTVRARARARARARVTVRVRCTARPSLTR